MHDDDREETPNDLEKRLSRRFPANGFAEFFMRGSLARGAVRDFSKTGCLVLTRSRAALDVGSRVQLRFSVWNTQFLADAEVVRVAQGEYVAFHFIAPNYTFQTKLEDIGDSTWT